MGKDEEKGKAEKAAEKTGEVVGKGLKKGFGVAKGLGSGLKKGVKGDKKKNNLPPILFSFSNIAFQKISNFLQINNKFQKDVKTM